jgi:SAM-dependent methyltransferase
MADVLDLPFRDQAFDLLVCLGVLHHLPVNALDAVRSLARLARRHLIYLYYALDNRPAYFRWALRGVTAVRGRLARVRSPRVRSAVTSALAAALYVPAAQLGRTPFRRYVPLAETYAGKSFPRLRQDAYDRFFTSIEQRVTRDEILGLTDTFATVTVSEGLPYWHFLCE